MQGMRVFARDAGGRLLFHPAAAPTAQDLDAIVARTARRVIAWLRKHGYPEEQPPEARSNEPDVESALDACAAIAMRRGNVTTLPRDAAEDDDGHVARAKSRRQAALVVERDGFNVHAGCASRRGMTSATKDC